MKIAIRMDDITPDMDWSCFDRFKELLDVYGVAPLIGVVPVNRDPNLMREKAREEFWEQLKELTKNGWVIAQHGYDHVYTTKKGGLFPLNLFSEYAGLSYKEQAEKIAAGKKELESRGIHTDIFMAPAHTFDHNTLKALKDCGFHYLTDGFAKAPYEREGLCFLPISSRKKDCFKAKDGYTTLVVHVNGMKDQEFKWYERMLAEHREKFISYGEFLSAPARKRGFAGNLAEYMEAAAKRLTVRFLAYRTMHRIVRRGVRAAAEGRKGQSGL